MPELNLEVPKRYMNEFIMRAKGMSAVVVAEYLTDLSIMVAAAMTSLQHVKEKSAEPLRKPEVDG